MESATPNQHCVIKNAAFPQISNFSFLDLSDVSALTALYTLQQQQKESMPTC